MREAFAELGVDREGIDAVFEGNPQRMYARWVECACVKGRYVDFLILNVREITEIAVMS